MLRDEHWRSNKAALISGNLGPRSDGYQTTLVMNAEQARDYHLPQIRSFAGSAADMVSVFTMNYSDEALGITLAVRANASCKSHAELEQSTELDAGDPQQLGSEYLVIRRMLPKLRVVGGCCGTDHRHVESICSALMRV